MQQVQSRLSIIAKAISNKPLNSFEFNGNRSFNGPNFQTVEEHLSSSIHELEFLVSASKLYCLLCPSLSSRLTCKVANLTSEIDQTKSYSEFFSGKICPKCFSVYLMGVNCRLDVSPIKGLSKRRLKNKMLKQSKVAISQFTNYSFKHVSITCSVCRFTFKRLYWEKKTKNTNNSNRPSNAHGNKVQAGDTLNYSKYIVNASNTDIQNNYRQDHQKKESPQDSSKHNINRNSRFFKKTLMAGYSAPHEAKNLKSDTATKAAAPANEDEKNKQDSPSLKGNSFYEILSMLG